MFCPSLGPDYEGLWEEALKKNEYLMRCICRNI